MRAGRLRYICRIETPSKSTSASGEVTISGWDTVADAVWCDVESAGASEELEGRVRSKASHKITCRWMSGIDTTSRLVAPTFGAGGAIFEIVGVADPDGRRRKLVIDAVRHDRQP